MHIKKCKYVVTNEARIVYFCCNLLIILSKIYIFIKFLEFVMSDVYLPPLSCKIS